MAAIYSSQRIAGSAVFSDQILYDGPTTSVVSDGLVLFKIRAAKSKDCLSKFRILSNVVAQNDCEFNVRATEQSDHSVSFATRAIVNSDHSNSFLVLGGISADVESVFCVNGAAVKDITSEFKINRDRPETDHALIDADVFVETKQLRINVWTEQ